MSVPDESAETLIARLADDPAYAATVPSVREALTVCERPVRVTCAPSQTERRAEVRRMLADLKVYMAASFAERLHTYERT
jgi:hypothetical protein